MRLRHRGQRATILCHAAGGNSSRFYSGFRNSRGQPSKGLRLAKLTVAATVGTANAVGVGQSGNDESVNEQNRRGDQQ